MIVTVAHVRAVILITQRLVNLFPGLSSQFDRSSHVGTAVALLSLTGQRVVVSEGSFEYVRPPAVDR
jgi:hypothetical protein